jgi:electron transfer flavoprotein beta subunit
VEVLPLASLGVATAPQTKVVRFEPPPLRQKGIMVKDAAELVAALHAKGLL